MRNALCTLVAVLAVLLVGCDEGAGGDAGAGGGAGGDAGNPGGGGVEVLDEPVELPNLNEAVDEVAVFKLGLVLAYVEVEQRGYRFTAAKTRVGDETFLPDGSCTWGLISDTPDFGIGGTPGSDAREVAVLASLFGYESFADGAERAGAGDRFSFWRQGDGDTQWGLFDESTEDEWSSVPDGNEEMACVDWIGPDPSYVVRRCRVSWTGTASENFSVRKSPAAVRLDCLYTREATEDDVVPDCSEQGEECLVFLPDTDGACTRALPVDSILSPITCDLDGALGMCVEGVCAEYGCGGACDDGDSETSDSCRRQSSLSGWSCQHEAL